jgi:hypothetical protein
MSPEIIADTKFPQTIDLQIECFTPYLPTAVSELVRLIGEAETFESKRRIDHSLNVVIEQAGARVTVTFITPERPLNVSPRLFPSRL